MGRNTNETTRLIPKTDSQNAAPPLKFPLGLVSEGVRPYLELIRLEKPTGTILMFWPFAWGLTMAAYTNQHPLQQYGKDIIKSFIAAFLLRSSACTINDIFDRKMDAGVERCRTRPLASGRVSVFAAVTYLFIQYALGVIFFLWTVDNQLALQVALFQLLPLFGIYPLMKRVTYWPQAWLGFAMNFGFITAWVSTTGSLDFRVLGAAMTGCWCWTMLYDTIYACQDMKDDVKMGVRSTAILWGSWIRPLLVLCGLGFISMLAFAGYINQQGPAYFVIGIGGTFLHLLWQYNTVDLGVPKSCWDNFNSNGHLGWILWGGAFLDYLIKTGVVVINL
ncbi:UbiA prenyltransferase [Coprinopsis marcescibilis]|uniref:4-hydroxybenzoate polyprenyltransferase, mitochondrial n=1 Tax=Coprinopsis marcescibilis TaxID=230819 RepID=A0A5C3L5G1_COPMA|nr:UbiA prenyltransferase [Coprinopsis marcescibilis]